MSSPSLPVLKEVTGADADSALKADVVPTHPIEGQKPGTSGLRKKTRVFMQGYYLHNFVQSIFDALPSEELKGCTLVVGGDGRYWTREAIQIITKIAFANGVGRIWVGQGGLLSTPAVSSIIRDRENGVAYGGIILTASHNPGGLEEDFGIKYNVSNGGPAPEGLTDKMFDITKTIQNIRMCSAFPEIDLDTVGRTVVQGPSGSAIVEVIPAAEDYAVLMNKVFDIPTIKAFVSRPDFKMVYDGLSGVAGAYAVPILHEMLGIPKESLHNCVPLPDFGGHHPDPNLTYAPELVETMGLLRDGTINPAKAAETGAAVPEFGAAQDGDADRNMVLGKRFFVTPSDSVAVIAANAEAIPFFASAGGLKGVARSMPTSAALDRVAEKRGLRLFEVPTGWKFFGNLMDSSILGGPSYNPFLCGEESFGTGSDHVREKDGLWAVLAWLSILAHKNKDTAVGSLVGVDQITRSHWKEFGRNFYCRYDYEGVASAAGEAVMNALRARIAAFNAAKTAAGAAGYTEPLSVTYALAEADEFRYVDPVDSSVSDKQGLRFIMADGSRVVFRLSGTGSVGATIRVYLEKYEPNEAKHDVATGVALTELVSIALSLSRMEELTGRSEPTVIT